MGVLPSTLVNFLFLIAEKLIFFGVTFFKISTCIYFFKNCLRTNWSSWERFEPEDASEEIECELNTLSTLFLCSLSAKGLDVAGLDATGFSLD